MSTCRMVAAQIWLSGRILRQRWFAKRWAKLGGITAGAGAAAAAAAANTHPNCMQAEACFAGNASSTVPCLPAWTKGIGSPEECRPPCSPNQGHGLRGTAPARPPLPQCCEPGSEENRPHCSPAGLLCLCTNVLHARQQEGEHTHDWRRGPAKDGPAGEQGLKAIVNEVRNRGGELGCCAVAQPRWARRGAGEGGRLGFV